VATPALEYERFNPFGDASSLGVLWRRLLRGFELMAESKGISAAPRKRALLFHYAGPDVQDIYFALSTESVTAATTAGSYFYPAAKC
jgi:hypothetical protein